MTKPSNTTDVYWIHAKRDTGRYPHHTPRGGKWLIFCPIEQIDQKWNIIKNATINGELGYVSKVSTSRPNPNSRDPNTGVICVYTYNNEDMDDVMEIRESLRKLGFGRRLVYKTDQATREGRYAHTRRSHRSAQRVTKYSN